MIFARYANLYVGDSSFLTTRPFLQSLKVLHIKRKICRTEPGLWQHFYCSLDSTLFCCKQSLQSMIMSAFIHIGNGGERVGVRNVKLLLH